MMYKDVLLIQKDLHKEIKFSPLDNMEFAATVSDTPISVAEFYYACKSQPIVFVENADEITPIALMGLKQGENLFLNKKNQWYHTEYCPIFLRHYPFVYIQTEQGLSLGYDKSSKNVNFKKGEPLFDANGELSELTKRILHSHDKFQSDMIVTRAFSKKLKELDLLTAFNPEVRIENNGYKFEGFLAVDENKFKSLSNEHKLELDQLGYYALIMAHLISLSNFQKLISLNQNTK